MDCPHLRTAGLKLVLTWTPQPQGNRPHFLSPAAEQSPARLHTGSSPGVWETQSSTQVSPLKCLPARAGLGKIPLWPFSHPIFTAFLQRTYPYSLVLGLHISPLLKAATIRSREEGPREGVDTWHEDWVTEFQGFCLEKSYLEEAHRCCQVCECVL